MSLTAITLVVASLVSTGCKKDDVTPPVVTVTGSDETVSLQGTYTELGATAKDDRDGNLTPVVSGTVNTDSVGAYTITYTATDAAGNIGKATRTVTVVNSAAGIAGTYTASEVDVNGPYTYNHSVVITASNVVNNRVILSPLGDYANNTVYMNVTGTNIDLPSQTVANVGTGSASCDVHSRTSSGTGTISGSTITLTYNDAKVSPCTGSRTGVVATFVKQ